jgi:DNA-binding IclR family transcriptional regulator
MGLDRAMRGLPGDRATELAVHDVLTLMSNHPGHTFTTHEIASRVGRPDGTVGVILSTLAAGYILKADEDTYTYERDPILQMDIQRFLEKSGAHVQFVQDNLARFRDRYGGR